MSPGTTDTNIAFTGSPGALARWLFAVAVIVTVILVVGGITRLTESGLSITEWQPITGAIPPLDEAAWREAFAAYRQIPQYTEVNGPAGMTLAQYKVIYFWEWLHRLLARLVGLAFALPLAWFWVKGRVPAGYKPRLLALLALGASQGAIGWWMVASGLSQDVKVSHLRLAVHLTVALVTLGALVWTALDMRELQRGHAAARLRQFPALVLVMLLVQAIYGALVAGLRAGPVAGGGWFSADAWPLMQGRFFPEGVDWASGPIHVLFVDPYLTHFIHRWWAWAVVAVLVIMARRLRRMGRRDLSIAIHCAFGTQVLLGVGAIWSGVALPIAAAHQLTGALLVASVVWGAHAFGRTGRPLESKDKPS